MATDRVYIKFIEIVKKLEAADFIQNKIGFVDQLNYHVELGVIAAFELVQNIGYVPKSSESTT